ncbi:MAG TPA: response regulator [Minicystis sp.]|nr:response regulator [Minicystis sp.]
MARILVVEDSAAMRAFVRGALETAPSLAGEVDVVEAQSGFDALRLLPRGRYDLVITDINMPDINGLELIKFVRQSAHHQGVPVLIISTQSSDKDKERGLALGADAFLAKPFTEAALCDAVVQSLGTRGGAPRDGGEAERS